MKTNKLQKIPLILFLFLFFSPILIYGLDTSELEKTLNEIREINQKLQEPIASSSSNFGAVTIGDPRASANKENTVKADEFVAAAKFIMDIDENYRGQEFIVAPSGWYGKAMDARLVKREGDVLIYQLTIYTKDRGAITNTFQIQTNPSKSSKTDSTIPPPPQITNGTIPPSHSISPQISHGTPIYQSQPRFKNCTYNYCNGCSCVSRTITISFNESCPSSSCSNNCNCCSNNVNCYPQVSLSIFPNRLFVNQVFNLTYKASGPSSCGNLTCQFYYEYKGHNCNVPSALGICPSQAQGKNVCDPENKIPRILQGKTSYPETTISIKADQEVWGTYYYKLTCCNSCNNCNSKEASVFVLPILYYQETPFSSILKPFISLIKK